MRTLQFLMIAFIIFQSCNLAEKKVDVKQAKEVVHLSTTDLQIFSQLRQQLIFDSAAIRQQDDETTPLSNRTSWMTTNSFYLNQIDSPKYISLFLQLKGKLVDHIKINKSGGTIFTIKENVQMNTDNYNETYSHQIVNIDCNCPINTVFNNVDSVFVDSTINREWKYVSYKVFTGH